MNSIKEKIVWLSAILLSAGYVILAPDMSVAQDRRQESHSMQATPNWTQPSHSERAEGNLNRGPWNNRERWQNRGRWNDRHGWDRNNFGVYWGIPYGVYWGTPYFYSPYDGNPYNMGYSDGYNAGRYDRIQGYLYNPRQYERSGDLNYFQGFVDGYEAGYRG
jgi:hypothetical protein